MELKEQWIKWEPLGNIKGDYYKDCVIDGCQNGFKVIIGDDNNEKKKIKIKFNFGVSCYRDTYETYAWMIQQEFLCGFHFYKAINSSYIKWLSEKTNSLSSDMEPHMQHFIIVTQDSTLEILASYEPEIEFVNLS